MVVEVEAHKVHSFEKYASLCDTVFQIYFIPLLISISLLRKVISGGVI